MVAGGSALAIYLLVVEPEIIEAPNPEDALTAYKSLLNRDQLDILFDTWTTRPETDDAAARVRQYFGEARS